MYLDEARSNGCDSLHLANVIKSKFIEKGKEVVVKKIQKTRKQAEGEMNFMRKVNLLLCPYLVKYLCYHLSNGDVYFIMEYYELGNLNSYLNKRNGQYFEEKELKRMVGELMVGLFVVHVVARFIHGDIKSDNIIVSNLVPNIDLKIIDFGSCSALASEKTVVTVRGTPGLMAPEVDGKGSDQLLFSQKSDIYCMGHVLYEIVYPGVKVPKHPVLGKHPFLQEELRIAINSMLSKKPENRPSIENLIEIPYIAEAIKELPQETLPTALIKKLRK